MAPSVGVTRPLGDEVTFRILVVCMANVCRSPVAGAMLGTAVERAGLTGHVAVETAGVSAQEGAQHCRTILAHTRLAPEVVGRLEQHAARQLTARDVQAADLVLAADREVRGAVVRAAPRHQAKVFTLRQVTELAPVERRHRRVVDDDGSAGPEGALRRWSHGLGMARGQAAPSAGRRSWPGAPSRGVHHHDIPDAHLGGRHATTSRLLVPAVEGVASSLTDALGNA